MLKLGHLSLENQRNCRMGDEAGGRTALLEACGKRVSICMDGGSRVAGLQSNFGDWSVEGMEGRIGKAAWGCGGRYLGW